jgi:hypothetical protein
LDDRFKTHRLCMVKRCMYKKSVIFKISPLQLVNLHRNRRYFVIKLHTWFCLSYFLKTNIKCYCSYQHCMSINSFYVWCERVRRKSNQSGVNLCKCTCTAHIIRANLNFIGDYHTTIAGFSPSNVCLNE